jgi:antirestriction protein
METITDNAPTARQLPDADAPRAWVACLGCYNGGSLNGRWVAGNVAGDVSQAVKVKLGAPELYGQNCLVCVRCGSDEFWVLDHDGYEGLLSGECDPMTAQRVAELWEEFNALDNKEELKAYCAYNNLELSNFADFIQNFENHYHGTWPSFRDYADNLADETILSDKNIPDMLRRYFDYEAHADELGYDYTVIELPAGDVAVFVD